jgi:hypothetical protein
MRSGPVPIRAPVPPAAAGAASVSEVSGDSTIKCRSNIFEVKHTEAGGHKPGNGDARHGRHSPGHIIVASLSCSADPPIRILAPRSLNADPSGR